MRVFYLCMLLFVSLVSCKDEMLLPDQEPAFNRAGDSLFVVEEQGFNIQFALPRALISMHRPQIYFNTAMGQLEIRAGQNFMLDISQEHFNPVEFKKDLREEQLFDYIFYDEGDLALTYKALLPSGEVYCSHHTTQINLGNEVYKVTSAPEGAYSEQHILWMKNCISTMRVVE